MIKKMFLLLILTVAWISFIFPSNVSAATSLVNIEVIDDSVDIENKGQNANIQHLEKKLPQMGERKNYFSVAGVIIIFLILCIRKRRKIYRGLLLMGIGLLTFPSLGYAERNETNVSAQIVAGEMALLVETDIVNRSVKLSEAGSTIGIGQLVLTIRDFSGSNDGWKLLVSTTDYDKQKNYFHLTVENQLITSDFSTVYESKNKKEKISLQTNISLSNSVKAGFYNTTLVWHLEPKVQNKILE